MKREPITLKELFFCLTVAAVCFALFHVTPIPTGVVGAFLFLGGIGRYVSRLRAGWICGTFAGALGCLLALGLGAAVLYYLYTRFGPNIAATGAYAVMVMIAAATIVGAVYGGKRAARDFGGASKVDCESQVHAP